MVSPASFVLPLSVALILPFVLPRTAVELPAVAPANPGGGEPAASAAAGTGHPTAGTAGARLFKSGPIQITADGRFVWVANTDNDSVARIATATDTVTELVLPDPATRDTPRGLSITEDGSEVWVACHDSDRVYVLRGSDGAVVGRIDLPWGSGPTGIALSRDQDRALVSLHRSAALAVLDRTSRTLTHVLEPVFRSPFGVAWTEDGRSAWVTHLFPDGEHPRLTRVDIANGGTPHVAASLIAHAADPRHGSRLAAPFDIAEGGYLTFRGHAAQIPGQSGRSELWLPTQYNNITEDRYSPDSTVQATIRHLDLTTGRLLQTNQDKVILTAVHVHDPVRSGNPYVGPGWNARVAGPIDIAFSSDGSVCYLLCELSDDLVVLPSDTPAVRPAGAPPLPEIRVGSRPMGLAVSPTTGLAYVANRFSRDVSVVDAAAQSELRRVGTTPTTGEPFAPVFLTGAKLFHTSADPRISANEKVACASCHIHAEHDGRDWAFHNLPGLHGPRPALTMRNVGRSFGPRDPRTGFGQLHRSGDRDEVQDFEHTFRSILMGGTGFLGNQIQPELGPPNAGRDPDLDALATYVVGLEPLTRSPRRDAVGRLTEAAVRGATFFVGDQPGVLPADADCASCHVPETGFCDRGFHDVGQRRPAQERELNDPNRAPFTWHVNTTPLFGLWATAPYDGVSTYADDVVDLLKDLASRTSHGRVSGLTGRQVRDLAEFLQSIDGDLTAAAVRGARDTDPPRVVRVEPASLTTVDVWFDEAVERASAENLANWRILGPGGRPLPVTAAVWSPRNGDRVTLTTRLEPFQRYTVVPGPILDLAASATGGVANPLDVRDPNNNKSVALAGTLTVTLGGSGYENIDARVHDSGMVGPGLATWNHDSPSLFFANGVPSKGFVRFDWRDAFARVSGVTSSSAIIAASVSLVPAWGVAHTIEARQCLQSWSDPQTGGDWNRNAGGAPTWRDHAHPNRRWNRAGAEARTPGVNGRVVGDYDGGNDIAHRPVAVVRMRTLHEKLALAGRRVTEAARFWFDHPRYDYGLALQLAPGTQLATRFDRAESRLGEHGPVLAITYELANLGPKRVPPGDK